MTTTLTTPTAELVVDPKEWSTAELLEYVGGLSNPSKMPGFAYGLPAEDCKVGGRLQSVEGSTCHDCYAMKGAYVWSNVKPAYRRRANAIGKPLWVQAMSELIRRKVTTSHKSGPYFRWHDSGDLQSIDHLRAICDVARQTPDVAHWLPTREYRVVSEYVDGGGDIPPNLNIRLSAHMVGGHVPTFPRLRGLVTVSTVSREGTPGSVDCPSRHQGNKCGDCRACWDRSVPAIDYHLH